MSVSCVVAVLSCGEAGAGPRLHKRYVGLYTGPYFDPSAPNNITTQLGTHAYLPCKVTTQPVTLELGVEALATSLSYIFLTVAGAAAEQQIGVVDPAPRRTHPHRGPLHLHRGRALPGLPRRGHRHLDPAGLATPSTLLYHTCLNTCLTCNLLLIQRLFKLE